MSDLALANFAVDHRVTDHLLPVGEQLQELCPYGGLRRGTVVTVIGATSIALSVVARATQSGMWCAVVGMPDLGAVAASELGVDLDRFPLIPDPGRDWPTVVSSLIDGFDLILMRATKAMAPHIARRLDARIRQRKTVLVLLASMPNAWPHTDYVIREKEVTYEGLDHGHGAINQRNFELIMEGRGSATQPRYSRLAV